MSNSHNSRKVAVFVGTRPEAIKLAPVIRELQSIPGCEPLVISTGQHREMLAQALDLFGIRADVSLDVMTPGQSLTELTSRLLSAVDRILSRDHVDFAIVQGDTTTALASALACFYRQVSVGHVEAGLRTHDLSSPFPEEANRVLISPLCSLHFAPTVSSRENLIAENIPASQVHVTGNTGIDSLRLEIERQNECGGRWRHFTPMILVTCHRRENHGDGLREICRAIKTLAEKYPSKTFCFPVHPNPQVVDAASSLAFVPNVNLLRPLSYPDFVGLLKACQFVLTDSGGIQEEAPSLGKPVLVMRDTTERPEGVAAGTVQLVGADHDRIVDGASQLIDDHHRYREMSTAKNPYGDGYAARRIAAIIEAKLSSPGSGLALMPN